MVQGFCPLVTPTSSGFCLKLSLKVSENEFSFQKCPVCPSMLHIKKLMGMNSKEKYCIHIHADVHVSTYAYTQNTHISYACMCTAVCLYLNCTVQCIPNSCKWSGWVFYNCSNCWYSHFNNWELTINRLTWMSDIQANLSII